MVHVFISRWPQQEVENKHHIQLPHAHTLSGFTCVWLSASNTLQSLSAMQQVVSTACPAKTPLRACKQGTTLWEKELMVSLDTPTESHLPSRYCSRRQQLAASVLFSLSQNKPLSLFFPIFPSSFSPCHRSSSHPPQLDELTWTGKPNSTVLTALPAQEGNVYLPHVNKPKLPLLLLH